MKKTVVITRSGSCARLSIHTTGPTGANVAVEKKDRQQKTMSNFLILKVVYVLFSRNRTVAIQLVDPERMEGWLFCGRRRKKKLERRNLGGPHTETIN